MYACDIKQKIIENQYNFVMEKINEYINSDGREVKIPLGIKSPCDDTIELLLLEGYDIIATTHNEELDFILYEISWEKAFDGKKGELKKINLDIEEEKLTEKLKGNFSDILSLVSTLSKDLLDNREDKNAPTEDKG